MSREIKFRAKKINKNEFVIGYYLPMVDKCRHYIYLALEYLNEHSRIEIDPKTLGQYTGLKDKNGKEMYEGDIVKYDGELTTVIFCYGSFFLEKFNFRSTDWVNADYMIVKGNIYENPELIGDKND